MKPTRSCEIYIDGASRGNPGPSGVGVVFVDGQRQPLHRFSKSVGQTTNNVAEYLALIYALLEALQQGYAAVAVKTDSELLARQINGQYRVREAHLRILHDLALHAARGLQTFSIAHIPRTHNVLADALAGDAAHAQSAADIPLRGMSSKAARSVESPPPPAGEGGDVL